MQERFNEDRRKSREISLWKISFLAVAFYFVFAYSPWSTVFVSSLAGVLITMLDRLEDDDEPWILFSWAIIFLASLVFGGYAFYRDYQWFALFSFVAGGSSASLLIVATIIIFNQVEKLVRQYSKA